MAKKTAAGWMTRDEALSLLEVSGNAFERYYRKRLRKGEEKRGADGHRLLFKAAALVRAAAEVRAKSLAKLESDPLGEGTTAEDGRYRRAKADLAELELARRRGDLVPLQEIREALGRLAGILRTAGEALGRDYGRDAQVIVDDVLTSFKRELERAL